MGTERLRELSEAECRALLATSEIGRVGVTVRALPAIFPVRYRLCDDHVLFRTSRDTLLAKVVPDAIVAFETDAVDHDEGHGWSVLVVGRAELLDAGTALEQVRAIRLPWTRSPDDFLVRIATGTISGSSFTTP